MEHICAWCGKPIEAPVEDVPEEGVSHGICDECTSRLLEETGVRIQDYLDRLEVPVLLVGKDGRIRNANASFLAMVSRETYEVNGYLGGEVFECIHAREPGGCRETIHCSGCVIRNTVMDTWLTGKTHLRIPASLHQGRPGRPGQIRFLISTEMMGEVVRLTVEDLDRST